MNHIFQLGIIITLFAVAQVTCDRPNGAPRRQPGSATAASESFKSTCGSSEEVAKKIAQCLKPMFDLIEGKTAMPQKDQDISAQCEQFGICEKCLRQISKDCISGLHKTVVGTFATSIGRFRKQECRSPSTRAKYIEPLQCVKRRGDETERIYNNMTSLAQGIRDLPNREAEVKLLKICCLLKEMDRDLERNYASFCKKDTQLILDIIHSITDDARNVLCLNPKCLNSLKEVSVNQLTTRGRQEFVEPIMQIVFMISTE